MTHITLHSPSGNRALVCGLDHWTAVLAMNLDANRPLVQSVLKGEAARPGQLVRRVSSDPALALAGLCRVLEAAGQLDPAVVMQRVTHLLMLQDQARESRWTALLPLVPEAQDLRLPADWAAVCAWLELPELPLPTDPSVEEAHLALAQAHYAQEAQALLPALPELSPLEQLYAQGFEWKPGVVLDCRPSARQRWLEAIALQTLELDKARTSAPVGVAPEQVLAAFMASPFSVFQKDGARWDTTVGEFRDAVTALGRAIYQTEVLA